MNKKQIYAIISILTIGLVIAYLILSNEKPKLNELRGNEHVEQSNHIDDIDAAMKKGPHGGKLFAKDSYGIEVCIYEQGVEPQFRLFSYINGKQISPSANHVVLTLERLGREPEVISFTEEYDYLKGNAVIFEPHSFKVTVNAQNGKFVNQFSYEQVEDRVSMTDAQVKQNDVEVLTASPAKIRTNLKLIGEIKFNEDKLVHLVPRLAGVVISVHANAGDRVSKGQLLAIVSSQSLADQRSDWLAAQKRLTLTRTIYEREKKLWEEKISAEQDYLQARGAMQEAEIEAERAQQKLASLGVHGSTSDLARYELRAPIDGIVIEKHLSLGEAIKDDVAVFVIADMSTVWAEMTIYTKDLNTIKIGQKVAVSSAMTEFNDSGIVSYVGSLVGEQTRTALARVVLANQKGIWRPGLPVNIELTADEIEVPVAVSSDAIQTMQDRNIVFGRYGKYFEARPIKLGRSDGKLVEVLSGLRLGEQYASKNSYLIKADLGKSSASHEH